MGIRELREGLSTAIRRVRRGETLEVTDHGRPVARIVPLERSSEQLYRLVADGKLQAPRAVGTRPAPLNLPSTMTSEEVIDILRGPGLPAVQD